VFAVRFLFFAGKGHVSRSVHAPSARQLADVFTKGLPSSLLLDFRDSLCVTNTVEPPGGWGGGCLSGSGAVASATSSLARRAHDALRNGGPHWPG
jgi:hypothetical protein